MPLLLSHLWAKREAVDKIRISHLDMLALEICA
jgi:hypothetical protein